MATGVGAARVRNLQAGGGAGNARRVTNGMYVAGCGKVVVVEVKVWW